MFPTGSLVPLLSEVRLDGDEVAEMLLMVVWVGLECSSLLSDESEVSKSSEESS